MKGLFLTPTNILDTRYKFDLEHDSDDNDREVLLKIFLLLAENSFEGVISG